MKRLCSLLLLALLPLLASAYDAEIDGIYYNLDSNKKQAEVTYLTTDYSIKRYVYTGTVNIPEFVTYDNITYRVTSIGIQAFSNSFELTSVTIPNSVTSIGHYAFSNCLMTSVTIGNSVTEIGWYAFATCPSLKTVTIPNSVTSIGNNAFQFCSGLTSISIPNSVTEIGGGAFKSCIDMRSVSIGSSVTSIGEDAFSGCSKLGAVTIPNSVTEIGSRAFENCGWLTSVTIGNGVKAIGSGAFNKCSALTEIYNYATTPQDITSYEFSNFSATLHVVPGYGAAYRAAYPWKNFQTIVEDATDGEPIEKPKLSLSASPSGGDVAAGTKVYLTAKANSSTVSGASIYYTLNGTTPSKNSTAYTSSGITINASCTLKAIAYKDGYEDSDVMEESYNIVMTKLSLSASPSGGDVAAGTKVYLTTKADDSAVSGASIYYTLNGTTPSKNSTVYTSSGITINASCTLKAIAYKDGYEDSDVLTTAYTVKESEDPTWNSCGDNVIYSLDSGTGILTIQGVGAMYDFSDATPWYNQEEAIEIIEIAEGVTSIGNNAFAGCSNLTSVTIPNSMTTIGNSAFIGCWSLTLVTFGNGVKTIGETAFAYCSALTSVTIPNSVTSIGLGAFSGCNVLTSVTIPNSVTSIGEYAFAWSGLKEIYNYSVIPQDIDSNTFSDYSATLYVPVGSVAAYKAKEPWSEFGTIVALPETPRGDANGDGKVDMDDATFVTSIILGTADATEAADVNNDGQVSMPDAMFIVNKILNGKFPDE